MSEAVETLRDEDVKNLAAFYATREPKAPVIRKPLTVAGQDETYLAKAMSLYHVGERENPMMFAISFLMAESDINKLAAFYAGQRKK